MTDQPEPDQPEPTGRTGRPTDCTPELTTEIADYIRGGMTAREAAIRTGIHDTTFRRWNREGQDWIEGTIAHETENADPPNIDTHPNGPVYADFHMAITQARAQAEGIFIGVIRTAALNADWKAAAWWLERSLPDRWAKREHHTLAGDTDQPLIVTLQFDDPPADDEVRSIP